MMNNFSDPVYFKELQQYSKSELFEKNFNESILLKLQKEDIVIYKEGKYQFKYVGVLIIDNIVMFVYPKYIPNEYNIKNDFGQVLKVIKKYNAENKNLDYENEENDELSFNFLSLMIHILEDYLENGVYTKIQNILEINGNNEINWDKTINDTYPIIEDNKPYYVELFTKSKIQDVFDYFRLLHECIITDCSKHLKSVGLLEVFDLPYVELSEKILEDFGDIEFIKQKLEKELYVEFNTQKQELLRFLHAYVSQKNVFTNKNFLTLFGTSAYWAVWEDVCAKVFLDKLNTKLTSLNMIEPLNEDYVNFKSIYDVIENPKWVLNNNIEKSAGGKLKPDIITFYKDNFIILDAKYYNLIFEMDEDLKNYPGISDITKQYLYHLCLDDFRMKHGYNYVKNALLFPTYGTEVVNKGHVALEIFFNLGLEKIQIIFLPAKDLNNLYLNDKSINEDVLELIVR